MKPGENKCGVDLNDASMTSRDSYMGNCKVDVLSISHEDQAAKALETLRLFYIMLIPFSDHQWTAFCDSSRHRPECKFVPISAEWAERIRSKYCQLVDQTVRHTTYEKIQRNAELLIANIDSSPKALLRNLTALVTDGPVVFSVDYERSLVITAR